MLPRGTQCPMRSKKLLQKLSSPSTPKLEQYSYLKFFCGDTEYRNIYLTANQLPMIVFLSKGKQLTVMVLLFVCITVPHICFSPSLRMMMSVHDCRETICCEGQNDVNTL